MTQYEFLDRIIAWAKRQSDIAALIQIGSRVQQGGYVDEYSDWDFHLISTHPQRYHGGEWVKEIASPWCVHGERSLRGSMKISAVFEGGLEADFVLLAAWQMKLVYWAMRHPAREGLFPARLRRGILETRVILLGSGHRVHIGGHEWERRLSALQVPWRNRRMSNEELERHAGAFWQKSVWVAKKIARPEPRSALLWLHKLIGEHVYALLEEESWLAGRVARPEALKAERWLSKERLAQTEIETNLDQKVLAQALLAQIDLFEDVWRSVVAGKGVAFPDHAAVAAWLREALTKVLR